MSLENTNLNSAKIDRQFIAGPYGPLTAELHVPQTADNGHLFLMCHGFRGTKEGGGRAVALADKAAAMGFSVLRFDFTPQKTLSCQVAEVAAVVAFCRSTFSKRIVLLGRSMGGSAALAFAAKDQDIAGLCLWSTPCDLYATFKSALGFGYERLMAGKEFTIEDDYGILNLTPDFVNDFANFDLIKCIRMVTGIPLLFVHGGKDVVVPVSQAKELYAAARQPKELVVIPDGDHQFLNSHQFASGAVLTWLARLLAGDGI